MDKAALEALKARNPIVETARALGLEVVRNRFRCPRAENHAHGDRTPSVTISPERGSFKCWVCPDVKGDVIDLVRLARGCGFAEAVAFLERNVGPGSPAPARGAHSAPARRQTELFSPEPLRAGPPKIPADPSPETRGNENVTDPEKRSEGLEALLELCAPVRGRAAAWLKSRRIFKKTWDGQGLRVVEDYRRVSDALRERFAPAQLREWGLFNAEGHLRFYRHALLLPYFDAGRAVYLQARALEDGVKPKELSLAGSIPCPYNARLLDGRPGRLYLCEGVIDTLTLLETGFPAVGIPGAVNFKPAWLPRFANKSVYVAFDADAAGEAGAVKALSSLAENGIEAHRLRIPAGKDINDWLRGGGLENPFTGD